jgi:nitrilase
MEERVKVAAVQIPPVFMDREATVDRACKSIEEAGKNGARLAVFSETFIPGFPYWRGLQPISRWSEIMVDYQKNSLRIPSSDTEVMCDAARDASTIVAMGCTEMSDRKGSCTLYNTILFIDGDGQILGRHRKLMPTHGERMVWGMGDASDVVAFDTDIGTIGGLVCYEHHMTLLKSAMALMGEEIHCAVWPGYWVMDRHPGKKKRWEDGDPIHMCDIEHAAREYAFENQCFVISVGQYIPDEQMPEWCQDFNVAAGGSMIVNPAGVVLEGPLLNKEGILYAELDPDDRAMTKAYFDCMGHYSRWDVMRLDLRLEPAFPALERTPITRKMIEEVADRHGVDPEELVDMISELEELD